MHAGMQKRRKIQRRGRAKAKSGSRARRGHNVFMSISYCIIIVRQRRHNGGIGVKLMQKSFVDTDALPLVGCVLAWDPQ